jgi:hypothetical protein
MVGPPVSDGQDPQDEARLGLRRLRPRGQLRAAELRQDLGQVGRGPRRQTELWGCVPHSSVWPWRRQGTWHGAVPPAPGFDDRPVRHVRVVGGLPLHCIRGPTEMPSQWGFGRAPVQIGNWTGPGRSLGDGIRTPPPIRNHA